MIAAEYESPAFLRILGLYAGDVEAQVARLDAGIVRSASCYVIIVQRAIFEALRISEEAVRWRAGIAKRARQKPVLALCLFEEDGRIVVARVTENAFSEIDDLELTAHLRSRELAKIVEGSQSCIIHAPAGHHLVTPSGHHSSIFLRVANAASCLDELDAMARWLAPEIHQVDAVLADNWNICPPVLRGMALAGRTNIPFDFFPGHTGNDLRAAREIVRRVLASVETGDRVLCIFSVTGSGSFAAALRQMFEDEGRGSEFTALSLYRFNDSDTVVTALCSLELKAGYANPDDCDACRQHSKRISVDPNVYYLREYKEEEVLLAKNHFEEPASLVSNYLDASDAFTVHRDDPNDGRHHALYIDVNRLLLSADFVAKCREKLATYVGRADVVVVPKHQAGKDLGRIAEDVLQIPLLVHDDLRPSEGLSHHDCAQLRCAKHLLIFDDVLMSGSRMDAFNKSLRENRDCFGDFDSVGFLAAVARPESLNAWKKAQTSLTKHAPWAASLDYVERMFLPFLDEKRCPWCLEYDFLSRFSNQLAEPPLWLQVRQTHLTRKTDGLVGEPLLLLPPAQAVTLGNGALAGPPGLSSMRTLFSVMSAVQNLRHDPDDQKRMWRSVLAANVFKPVNFMNYSEALIRAALLRSLDCADVGQNARLETNAILLNALPQPDQRLVLGELLFAMYRGLVPKTSEKELLERCKMQVHEDSLMLLRNVLSQ